MNKYEDGSMVKQCRVQAYLTQEEHEMLKEYGIQIRAPSVASAAREAILRTIKSESKVTQNQLTFEETNNERKERSKEKKETKKEPDYSLTHTREDLEILVSWLSDNEQWLGNLCRQNRLEIRGTATETLRPRMQEFFEWLQYLGEDIHRKGLDDTRRHFATWLPKHLKVPTEARNYGKTEARTYGGAPSLSAEQMADQLRAKRRREEATEELLRQFDDAQANAVSYKEFITIKK